MGKKNLTCTLISVTSAQPTAPRPLPRSFGCTAWPRLPGGSQLLPSQRIPGVIPSTRLFRLFPLNPPPPSPPEPLLWSPVPLDFQPSTSSCSSPGGSSVAAASGSVPKGLREPVLHWRMVPGLALAVCPAQTTFKRYFHRGHKLYLGKKTTQKNTTRKESMFYTKKKPFSWPAIS